MEPNMEVNARDDSKEVKVSKKAIVDRLRTVCKELVEQDAKFGRGKKFVHFEIDGDKEGADQFAAEAIFGNIQYEDETTSSISIIPVVIKTEPTDRATREFFYSHFQFSNEILFYTQLLPFLNSFQDGSLRKYSVKTTSTTLAPSSYPFAKFLKGGQNDPVLSSYVIMENASSQKFRLTTSRQLLDLEHFQLLMDRLGRFHALSYIAKVMKPDEFHQLTSLRKETSWTDERLQNGHESFFFIQQSVTRSIEKFDKNAGNAGGKSVGGKIQKDTADAAGTKQTQESFEHYQDQVKRVKSLVYEDPLHFMRGITKPKEPMAVLCHGDFCRNNILFQYDDNSSAPHPIDVLFFDLATIRYASPVIDLSFCIYLNSDETLRRLHWNDIIKSYHEGLQEAVQGYAKEHGVEVIEGKSNYTPSSTSIFLPSLTDVHSEFRLHALYGFVHCSFFLPTMLAPPADFAAMLSEGKEFWNLTKEEQLAIQDVVGGDEATRMLNDIVQHMFDMGFV